VLARATVPLALERGGLGDEAAEEILLLVQQPAGRPGAVARSAARISPRGRY
jgi:hypothetical protein